MPSLDPPVTSTVPVLINLSSRDQGILLVLVPLFISDARHRHVMVGQLLLAGAVQNRRGRRWRLFWLLRVSLRNLQDAGKFIRKTVSSIMNLHI
jgi:hypothetical protein